jgi:hypothetical protein
MELIAKLIKKHKKIRTNERQRALVVTDAPAYDVPGTFIIIFRVEAVFNGR